MPIPMNQVVTAEVIVHGEIAAGGSNNRLTQWVSHWRRTAVTIDPTKAALFTALNATLLAAYLAALNERYSSSFVTIRWLEDAEDLATPTAFVGTGAVTGDGQQSDEAAYLLKRSTKRGGNFRGSSHIAPMSEADVTQPDDDIWNSACLTRLGNLATAMSTPVTDSTPNTWNPCILSRTLSQLSVNPTTVITTDIATMLVNKRVGSMKVRKVKSVY